MRFSGAGPFQRALTPIVQVAWVMGSVGRTQVIPPSLRYLLITGQLIHNPAQGGRERDRPSPNEVAELWLS